MAAPGRRTSKPRFPYFTSRPRVVLREISGSSAMTPVWNASEPRWDISKFDILARIDSGTPAATAPSTDPGTYANAHPPWSKSESRAGTLGYARRTT